MSALIGRIDIQPTSPRPAETVRVEVFGTDGKTLVGSSTKVSIDGVPGALQHMQFSSVGQRRIGAAAVDATGNSERLEAIVQIAGAPLNFTLGNRSDLAMIGVTQSPAHPYRATLSIGTAMDTQPRPVRVPSRPTRSTARVAPGSMSVLRQARAFAPPNRPATSPVGTSGRAPTDVRPAPSTATSAVATATMSKTPLMLSPRYVWDFGDGTSAVSRSPTIVHDYFATIDHAAGVGQFTVSCRVVNDELTVKRTLTIKSVYAMCKAVGTVVPHVVAETFAGKCYDLLRTSMTVHNVEPTAMALDRFSVTPLAADGAEPTQPHPFVTMTTPITIPAGSSATIGINVPFVEDEPVNGQLRYDITGFSVVYGGTVGRHLVRCTRVFDVPVAQWGVKPRPIGGFVLPGQRTREWPWDKVKEVLASQSTPADRAAGIQPAVLDATTGTVAFGLGRITPDAATATRRARSISALAAVLAPADGILAAQRSARPTATPAARTAPVSRPGSISPAQQTQFETRVRGFGSPMLQLKTPPKPGSVKVGEICDPDNISDADLVLADGQELVCQQTDVPENMLLPARWMNARKGDIVLAPGGSGKIAGLMLNMQPPQWYSHCGIMTTNYEEITHCTGSESRLKDHLAGLVPGSNGIDPLALKFVWPGAIVQSVEDSIQGGAPFFDPDNDKWYPLSPFGAHDVKLTHGGTLKVIHPMVIKPRADLETKAPALRTLLHTIADEARNDAGTPGDGVHGSTATQGKFHYRWFCYTDPTIGRGPAAGAEAGWARGTRGAVCSSFIWLYVKKHAVPLEAGHEPIGFSDLEPGELAAGAAVRPGTPDGLYLYTAQERLQGGAWLWLQIMNEAVDSSGIIGATITAGGVKAANGFLNAFANDGNGGHSFDWQQTVDADAVSPDNMLWWDGPEQGGLYGYAEPAQYREPRNESYTVSRWKHVISHGDVHGKVFANGLPVAQATVSVPGHREPDHSEFVLTAADGSYTLRRVAFGSTSITASKTIVDARWTGHHHLDLSTPTAVADLELTGPSPDNRLALVDYDFVGVDDEVGKDEVFRVDGAGEQLAVSSGTPCDHLVLPFRWGGELNVEYHVFVWWSENHDIDVAVVGNMYEGTSEHSFDHDGQTVEQFTVAPLKTVTRDVIVTNTEENLPDSGKLTISVTNSINTV